MSHSQGSSPNALLSHDAAWRYVIPTVLMLLTAAIRLWGIADNSFTQDESTMVLFAQGVLERGYPFLRQAHADFTISTYELVPYPIALSIGLFGLSEFAVRLPAVVFAVITVWLILRFAATLFDRRTAVLSAVLFATLPWAVYWGSNAFYPSQVGLAALLATMAMHRIIVTDDPPPRDYYRLLGAVTFTYLTWEGSAGLLPTLFLMMLVLRWGRWQWVSSVHAWTVVAATIFLVVAQFTWRTVLREPYQGVITGRSDVSFAKLAITTPGFDPYFYPVNLFGEAHLLLAASFGAGLFLLRRSFGLRLLYLLVFLYIAMLASLLGYYALRYVFLTAPAFVMIAAAVTVMLADRVGAGSVRATSVALAGLGGLHLAVATPWGVQPNAVSPALSATARPHELRRDLPGFPFRAMAQLFLEHYRQGDKVIVQAPFPFEVYTGLSGDYFLQSITASSVFFEPAALPYYTDKWAANPVLRNQAELDEVLARYDRVWFVSAPDGASSQTVGSSLYESLVRRMTLVGDTGDGRLFLWEHPRVRLIAPPAPTADARPKLP